MSTCITCQVYRPDADPRLPNRPPVCDGDRHLADRHLADVGDMHHQLLYPEPLPSANTGYVVELANGVMQQRGVDPLADLLPAGPVAGESSQPRVSGSREAPAPLALEPVDLTLPARAATRRLFARGRLGLDDDQVGTLSTATILDTWVRDWRGTLWPDQSLPLPTVPELVRWLRNRLEDACDQHPAIDEFAAEVRELRSALRAALGEIEPQPETDRYEGIACRRCDLRAVLMRRPGDAYIECGNCGLLYTDDELDAWAKQLAGYERSVRSAEEITSALRRPTIRHAV